MKLTSFGLESYRAKLREQLALMRAEHEKLSREDRFGYSGGYIQALYWAIKQTDYSDPDYQPED